MKISKKRILLLICIVGFVISSMFSVAFNVFSENGDVLNQTNSKEVCAYYIEGSQKSTVSYGNFDEVESIKDINGLIANLSPKDKLVLRGVIDLREKNKNDLLISTIIVPNTLGSSDAARIRYEIVDIYNPDNYITVELKPYMGSLNITGAGTAYAMANASNGQKPSAYDRTPSMYVHVNNDYGTWTRFAFHGMPENDHKLSQSIFGISYDIEENYMYIYDGLDNNFVPLIDFDAIECFGENLWGGFTTGEVYVKVFCDYYEKEQARIFVTHYDGYDLSNATIEDVEGPNISVDYGDYSQNDYPKAVVGKKYRIYPASAFDVYSGKEDVVTKIYLNYYSSKPILQSMYNKRTLEFIPNVEGVYTIEYSSVDDKGNISIETVDIIAVDSKDVTQLSLSIGEYQSSVKIGDIIALPQTTVVGEIGLPKLDVFATLGEEQVKINDGKILVEKTGVLTIEYVLSDYSGRTYNETIEIVVNSTDKPSFIDIPVFPKYLVEGNVYALPKINAYNYVDGSGDVLQTVVKEKKKGNNVATVINENAYIPMVAEDKDEVEIIYEATVNGKTESYSHKIPVIKTHQNNNLKMEKYFIVSGAGNVEAKTDWVQFNANGDASFTFVNSIYASEFSIEFSTLESSQNIGDIKIRLTDYYDENNQIVFTYKNKGNSTEFSVSGSTITLPVSTRFESGTLFKFNYDNTTARAKFDIKNNNYLTVTKNENGQQFKGFLGQEYYISIEFEDVKNGEASLAFKKINSAYFSADTQDYVGPNIDLLGEYGGEMSLNDIYELPKALVFDILDGKVSATVTVTDTKGNVVTDKSGKKIQDRTVGEENIAFKLSQFGAYRVNYVTYDGYGNRGKMEFTVRVVDNDGPTININGTIVETAVKGDKISIPSMSVSDNKSSGSKIEKTVYLIQPNGNMQTINSSYAGFVANEVGIYRVIYCAIDEEGNQTTKTFTIKVTEE